MSSENVAENSSVCLRLDQQVEDPADVGHEAHVQHPVRLVEDEDLDLAEVGRALADEVEQAAGRGDEDLDAGAQLLDLRVERHAAVDHRARAAGDVAAVGLHRLGDLDRELAGRRQDEAADRVAGRRERGVRVGLEAVEDRQRERGGLAGAGLGGGEDVAALEHEGDGPFLDGRGLRVALLGDGLRRRSGESPSSSKCKMCRGSPGAGSLWAAAAWCMCGGPARRPRDPARAAANRRTGRSIRENAAHGHPGHARDRRRAACGHRAYELHEYAHDARSSLHEGGRGYALEAVEALGPGPGSRVQDDRRQRSTGGSGSRSSRPTPRSTSRPSRTRSAGARRRSRAAAEAERATGYVLGGISPLGTRRALPTAWTRPRRAWPTIHVSAGRRGLEIELAPADLVRSRRRSWPRSRAAERSGAAVVVARLPCGLSIARPWVARRSNRSAPATIGTARVPSEVRCRQVERPAVHLAPVPAR